MLHHVDILSTDCLDGEKELQRDSFALLWSASAVGLSMGDSLRAKGIFHASQFFTGSG
nr:hypothetical protein [Yersinia aldovae]